MRYRNVTSLQLQSLLPFLCANTVIHIVYMDVTNSAIHFYNYIQNSICLLNKLRASINILIIHYMNLIIISDVLHCFLWFFSYHLLPFFGLFCFAFTSKAFFCTCFLCAVFVKCIATLYVQLLLFLLVLHVVIVESPDSSSPPKSLSSLTVLFYTLCSK